MNAEIVNIIMQHLESLVSHYEAKGTVHDTNPSPSPTLQSSSTGKAHTQRVRSSSDPESQADWNRRIEAIHNSCERLFSVGGMSLSNAAQMFAEKGDHCVTILIKSLETATQHHPDLLKDLVLIINALIQHHDGQKSSIPQCTVLFKALGGCIKISFNCRNIKLVTACLTNMMRMHGQKEELVKPVNLFLSYLKEKDMLPSTVTSPYVRTHESKSKREKVHRPPGSGSIENRQTNLQMSYVDVSTCTDPDIVNYCLEVIEFCKELTNESKSVPKVMAGIDLVRWTPWVNAISCLTICLTVTECQVNVKSALVLAKIGALCFIKLKPKPGHVEDYDADRRKSDAKQLLKLVLQMGTYNTLWKMIADANSFSPSVELQAATVALFFLTNNAADPAQDGKMIYPFMAIVNPLVGTETVERAINSLLAQIGDPNCQGSVLQFMSPVLAIILMHCNEKAFQDMQLQKPSPQPDLEGVHGRKVIERQQLSNVNSELASNACKFLFSSDNILCIDRAAALRLKILQTCSGNIPTNITAVNKINMILSDEVEQVATLTLGAVSDELSAQDKKARDSLVLTKPPLLTIDLGWDTTLEEYFEARVEFQLEI
jgi:hypothetical protein